MTASVTSSTVSSAPFARRTPKPKIVASVLFHGLDTRGQVRQIVARWRVRRISSVGCPLSRSSSRFLRWVLAEAPSRCDAIWSHSQRRALVRLPALPRAGNRVRQSRAESPAARIPVQPATLSRAHLLNSSILHPACWFSGSGQGIRTYGGSSLNLKSEPLHGARCGVNSRTYQISVCSSERFEVTARAGRPRLWAITPLFDSLQGTTMPIFGRDCGFRKLCFPAVGVVACASTPPSLHADLRTTEATLSASPVKNAESPEDFDGTLSGYLQYAYAESPALRATFESWRAASFRPDQERRLPEPTVSYAAFLRSVETRVGPQRHRVSASQWFPWPTKLSAGSDAATLEAKAAQQRFEGRALAVAAEVSTAYWALWRTARHKEVLREEIDVLQSLAEQVEGRVAVGVAELSDLAQLDLMLSRARDRYASLAEQEVVASVRLVRVLGASDGTATPVSPLEPDPKRLVNSPDELAAGAAEHPDVRAFQALSSAAEQREREARADRAPSFGLGVDWILTGDVGTEPLPTESGKDAVALSLSVKVPLWSRAYRAAEAEARARGAASRSRAIDARNGVSAEVRAHAVLVDDAARRVEFFDGTLIPQALTAFESVSASYAAGRSTVAELLLAEQALLGLRAERYTALATYGTELALLERAVGRHVQTSSSSSQQRDSDDNER